jgi:DNA-directed RNA polymerase subunit alpha
MIENREARSKEIGYIEMDSIFSPIYSVGINIENVRVGKITNWDRLILDILTDGTINYKDAFESATKILIAQFKSILSIKEDEEANEKTPETAITDEKEMISNEENIKINEQLVEDDEDSDDQSAEEPKKRRGRPKKIND